MAIIVSTKRRSIQSYLFEKLIKRLLPLKKDLSSIEHTRRFIEREGATNHKPYKWGRMRLKSEVVESYRAALQVFTLNDQKDSQQKVVLYLHGGAHVMQPTSYHWRFMDQIAQKSGAKLIAPIYPKVPHFTYRDSYPKLLNLYKEMLEDVESPIQLTIMGDSAGGNLSLGLAQLLREEQIPQPKDIVLLSACVDMVLDNPVISDYERRDPMLSVAGYEVIRRIWAADRRLDDPLISPIYGNFEGLAKISHFIGTHEGLYPDAMVLDKKLTDLGIDLDTYVYPKMNHVFVILPIPEAKDAKEKIIKIIKSE